MTDTPDTPSPPVQLESSPADPQRASLIEYPSPFSIKVMGVNVEGFVHTITQVARAHDPAFDAGAIELRESQGGRYLGITLTITATSREQLDGLYRALTAHPMVKVVL